MRSSLLLLAGLASYALGLPSASVKDRSLDLDLDTEINIGNIHAELDLDVFIGGLLQGGVESSTSFLTGLSAQAAAALQAGALGCSVGKIHHSALVELKTWLHGAVHLEAGLKKALLAWCDAGAETTLDIDIIAGLAVLLPTCSEIVSKGGLFVTIDGIFEAAKLEAVAILNAAAQSSLSAWMSGHVHLGADIKAALSLCAGGGVVGSLTAEVKAALKAWLHSSECALHHGLKISVLAWLEGKIEGDVISIGQLSEGALSSVSVGATILALVGESGALVHSARQSLIAFLHSDVAVHLEADIKAVLESCAKGELAVSLSAEVRTALALWLSSSSCTLGAQLKAVLLFWLSFAIDVDSHLGFHHGLISDLLGFLTGTLGHILGDLRGVLSILLGGESFLSLSLQARAEIIAILAGATSIELPSSCITIIIQWVTGCILPGGGSSSTTSMIAPSASSTPGVSIPVVSTTPSTPSVSIPVVTPAPSSSAPAGSSATPSASNSVPVVPGPNSSSTSEGGKPVPTTSAVASSSVPVVPGPNSSSTPEGGNPVPTTSAVASSSVPVVPGPNSSSTPEGGNPVPTSSAVASSSVPVVPGPGSSSTPEGVDPVPTTTAVSTSSSVPQVPAPESTTPAASTPCSTETVEVPGPAETQSSCSSCTVTIEIPPAPVETETPCSSCTGEIVPPAVTSAPAPASTNEPKQTVTVTTTVSIAACE